MDKIVLLLLLLACAAGAQAKAPARSNWMAGKYGMMTHWFVYPEGDTAEEKTARFNQRVDAFDLDGYMKQFDDSGASWLIFTLCQNNGYWNTRSEYLDKYLPGHYPERDLALEIAKRVKKRGKRFILYIAGSPVDFPRHSPEAAAAFGWEPGADISESPEFEARWLEYLSSLSRHFGTLCDGWWIDGLYPNVHKGRWHFDRWQEALRAGNPRSAVALSDASFCVGKLTNLCPGNDYFPGETHLIEDGMIRIDPLIGGADAYGEGRPIHLEEGKVRRDGEQPRYFTPASQYIDGVQLHSLLALDLPFSPMPTDWVSYPREELLKFVRNMTRVKGAVTINVPIDDKGHIPESSIDKLAFLKDNLIDTEGRAGQNRAEWMAGGYGLMNHWFLYPDVALPQGTQEEKLAWFNRNVNDFDLDGYMKQFDESGASWLIFTLSQSNGWWNTRCSYFEKYLPDQMPDRDLALEIAREVKKRGKRFILYIAGNPLGIDQFSPKAARIFGWEPGTELTECQEFEPRWLEYIASLSEHFGTLCDGWWIDGLYQNVHKGKWHFDKWFEAFRKGNPRSAVALSDAGFCVGILTNLCPGNDYFAGETHLIEDGCIRIDPLIRLAEDYGEGKPIHLEEGKVRLTGQRPRFFYPSGQYIDGVQLHSLLALDLPFSSIPTAWVSHSPEELLKFVQNMRNARGAVTINLPIEGNGHIPQKSLDKLIYLKEHLR